MTEFWSDGALSIAIDVNFTARRYVYQKYDMARLPDKMSDRAPFVKILSSQRPKNELKKYSEYCFRWMTNYYCLRGPQLMPILPSC